MRGVGQRNWHLVRVARSVGRVVTPALVADDTSERDAHFALWRLAIVRKATDQATRDYVINRQSEGKTKSEAIR